VQLSVTVDGVRRMRSFSLSHAPLANGTLRLTIKAHATGCVSRFVHETARVGDVVTLSAAQGSFVLPERVPDKLLFVSGGSGLTPLIAMAQQLVCDGYRGSLIWLHSERDIVPLVDELHAFTRQLPDMQLYVHRTADGGRSRRVCADLVAQLAPDWQQREAFVCGPQGLMTAVKALFAEHGRQEQVHSESFQPAWHATAPDRALTHITAKSRLSFAKSKIQSDARAGVSLLEQAEHVGLRPLHGCRMGICKTCLCTKLSGSVRNELTGEVSDARDEEIQLCIHTPLSDVSLDL
jgi:ferredoxin-NADP reductase